MSTLEAFRADQHTVLKRRTRKGKRNDLVIRRGVGRVIGATDTTAEGLPLLAPMVHDLAHAAATALAHLENDQRLPMSDRLYRHHVRRNLVGASTLDIDRLTSELFGDDPMLEPIIGGQNVAMAQVIYIERADADADVYAAQRCSARRDGLSAFTVTGAGELDYQPVRTNETRTVWTPRYRVPRGQYRTSESDAVRADLPMVDRAAACDLVSVDFSVPIRLRVQYRRTFKRLSAIRHPRRLYGPLLPALKASHVRHTVVPIGGATVCKRETVAHMWNTGRPAWTWTTDVQRSMTYTAPTTLSGAPIAVTTLSAPEPVASAPDGRVFVGHRTIVRGEAKGKRGKRAKVTVADAVSVPDASAATSAVHLVKPGTRLTFRTPSYRGSLTLSTGGNYSVTAHLVDDDSVVVTSAGLKSAASAARKLASLI